MSKTKRNMKDILTKEEHISNIESSMLVYVLKNIKNRKISDNIKDGSEYDIFPSDIFESYDNYISAEKRIYQKSRDKYPKYLSKKKNQIPIKDSDNYENKENENKKKEGEGEDEGEGENKSIPKQPSFKLKQPINIQNNWIFFWISWELNILKDVTKLIKDNPSIKEAKLGNKSPALKLFRSANNIGSNIIDKYDKIIYIENKTKLLADTYNDILSNDKISNFIASIMMDFMKILAWNSEIEVWNSTTGSRSCNMTHFIKILDEFRKLTKTNITPHNIRQAIYFSDKESKITPTENKMKKNKIKQKQLYQSYLLLQARMDEAESTPKSDNKNTEATDENEYGGDHNQDSGSDSESNTSDENQQ